VLLIGRLGARDLRHRPVQAGLPSRLAGGKPADRVIRSETASDLRTLTATGAGAPTQRNLTAVTAGALGLLGALTGTAIACLAAISWFRQAAMIASTAPAAELAAILAGLPLSAATGGWLFAGRQPDVIARQPLE
jgi:putative ABC transport system permease protein